MEQVNFNDADTILVDVTDKYSLYYNTESQVISITNGIEQYGVDINKLGNEVFTNEKEKRKANEQQ